MSYSICNVLTEAGLPNIKRWLPFEEEDSYIRNQLRNKMIRPTTIPQDLRDLQIEQAAAREALRLAFIHHKSLAREMVGVQQQRDIGELFEQKGAGKTLVDLIGLDMIVGSGGVLAHAPEFAQTALMMMDAYAPEGKNYPRQRLHLHDAAVGRFVHAPAGSRHPSLRARLFDSLGGLYRPDWHRQRRRRVCQCCLQRADRRGFVWANQTPAVSARRKKGA